MSTKRRTSAKKIPDPNGKGYLCSCGCGRKPKPPRRTWYSDACIHEWRIRNDPAYVRLQLLERDKGRCAACGRNAETLKARVERLARTARGWPKLEGDREWGYDRPMRRGKLEMLARWCRTHGFPQPFANRSWWDADHITEVIWGGGQCSLENYQTLCVPCHKRKTARLAKVRAAERKREKERASGQLSLPLAP
jgi:5-methylcytosine-specific restriction endonuclease McrA